MKSKVCGLPSLEVAERIIALKPDSIGIYCWGEDWAERGRNFCSFEVGKMIAKKAKIADVDTFYLTFALTAEELVEEWNKVQTSHIQLLNDIKPTEITKAKYRLPDVNLVKVVGIVSMKSIEEARDYMNCHEIDALLLDSRVSGTVRGGTGMTHDWNVSCAIVSESPKPVWLAGGIRPENVMDAMKKVRPYGIDAETGLQNADGSKNYEAIEDFIRLIKKFEQ